MASLSQAQLDAAQAFANVAIEALSSENGAHPETVIAGVARMAGTCLFRSFGFTLPDLTPGQVVLSNEANEHGPQLFQIAGNMLQHLGVALDPSRLGQAPGPDHQPQLEFLDTQRLLEPRFEPLRAQHGLSFLEAAQSNALATAFLIHHCAALLDPELGFGLAMQGFITGAKTAPDPVVLGAIGGSQC